jgi:DNA-binding response OmpR family regulator/DNA-binding CsgD family transcriptional regulator
MAPAPAKILIVDDVPANLGVLFDALTGAGHEVLVAESGESALALLPNLVPDLILLDVWLPGMDGFAACAAWKRDPQWREIPVIFLTSLDTPAEKVRAFAAGAVDYVTKPIEPSEVVARVDAHLRLQRLQRELATKAEALAAEVAERRHAEERLRHSLDRAVVLAGPDGRIVFATTLAEHLLRKHFPDARAAAADLLPEPLRPLLAPDAPDALTLDGAGCTLTTRVLRAPAGTAPSGLLLEESRPRATPAALLPLGLTLREADVLYWVSEGKSNAEIGLLLGASRRTIEKHLENIFTKLGLENRASAMRTALAAFDAATPAT